MFCQFGASTSILADAHPHIGTDKLPRVIENMRNQILQSGGEVHFQTKMTSLLMEGDTVVGVEAVDQVTGQELVFRGPVILATGHSARDVYRFLHKAHVEMEAKGIAVGVRLEHPAQLIDQLQYHSKQGRGKYLPAAEYSMVTQVDAAAFIRSACVLVVLSYPPPPDLSKSWSTACRPAIVAQNGATRAWWSSWSQTM